MFITQLHLTNMRAFREAKFNFHPGMNLLVGINGVGKSTVLDAIRVLFSQIMHQFSYSEDKPTKFVDEHITIGKDFLDVSLTCKLNQQRFEYSKKSLHKISQAKTKEQKLIRKLDKMLSYPDGQFSPSLGAIELTNLRESNPLAIYFSPYRSILNPVKPRIKSGISPAHSEALIPRQLNLQEFID